jgi:ABC-2 type transport system permease protein/lipopolysaccharide transport system permease protein
MISSTAFIFSSILHNDFFDYLFYVFAGMIPWLFISQSIFSSSNVYISNEALIRKVKIDLALLPIANLLVVLFDSLITCFLYLILMTIKNHQLYFTLLQLIPAYIILILFCTGSALIFSVLTVYFRDIQWLVQMGMQTLFFLTPVLYRPEFLSGNAQFIVKMNPLTPLIQLFSNILNNQIISISDWAISLLLAFIVFVIGLFTYTLNRTKIIFRI